MTDPYTRLADALRVYADALHAAWAHEGFTAHEPWRKRTEKVVVTTAEEEAPRLPETAHPVRGASGVSVRVTDRDSPESAYALRMRAEGEWHTFPPMSEEETALSQSAASAFQTVCDVVWESKALHERMYLSRGYKTHSGDEARAKAAERKRDEGFWEIDVRFLVGAPFQRAMDALGFDPRKPEAFDQWEEAVERTVADVKALVERTHWSYDIVALLNAPPVDEEAPIHLTNATVAGQSVSITIEHASDDLLTQFAHGPYNFSNYITGAYTSPINAALRVRLALPVEAPEAEYIEAVRAAADLFRQVVDVLRLVYTGDLGIVGVEPLEVDEGAPGIRTFNSGYNPTFASILPRRTFFHSRSTAPLTEQHVAELRVMLPPYLDGSHGVKGLDVAVRRYRDSRERHRPGDPEALLDLTAAYEALVLNDGGQNELSYRLALRVARLFGPSYKDRFLTFEILRGMYAARSKLAHGATLDSMKPTERARTEAALDMGPGVFRWIVRHCLMGEGPSNLRNRALTNWWREVELGDGSPFTTDDNLFALDRLRAGGLPDGASS